MLRGVPALFECTFWYRVLYTGRTYKGVLSFSRKDSALAGHFPGRALSQLRRFSSSWSIPEKLSLASASLFSQLGRGNAFRDAFVCFLFTDDVHANGNEGYGFSGAYLHLVKGSGDGDNVAVTSSSTRNCEPLWHVRPLQLPGDAEGCASGKVRGNSTIYFCRCGRISPDMCGYPCFLYRP